MPEAWRQALVGARSDQRLVNAPSSQIGRLSRTAQSALPARRVWRRLFGSVERRRDRAQRVRRKAPIWGLVFSERGCASHWRRAPKPSAKGRPSSAEGRLGPRAKRVGGLKQTGLSVDPGSILGTILLQPSNEVQPYRRTWRQYPQWRHPWRLACPSSVGTMAFRRQVLRGPSNKLSFTRARSASG